MRRRRDPSVPLVPDERGERHEFIPAESGHPGKSPSCCAIRGDTPAGRRGKGRDQHPGHSVGPRRGDRKERRRPGCYDGSERALLLRFPREVEAGGPTGVAERKYTSFPVQSEFLRPVRDSRAIPEDIKFVLQDLIIQYYIFTYHFSVSGCHGLSTVDGLSRFVRGASARNGNDAGPRVVLCASCLPIAPPPPRIRDPYAFTSASRGFGVLQPLPRAVEHILVVREEVVDGLQLFPRGEPRNRVELFAQVPDQAPPALRVLERQ